MSGDLATQPIFPGLADGDGAYESFYLKACSPREPLGIWIRYTVHKRPGRSAKGSLWATLFDARESSPLAVKETSTDLGTGLDHYIRIGESRLGRSGAVGKAAAPGREASWQLTCEGAEPPFFHLSRDVLYRAPVPRTKLVSTHPDVRWSGSATVCGRTVELDGWRGMVGHNWGTQHAERWIWLHGAGFDGDESAWFDAALGRIKLGPWTTPWIGNACLSLGGVRIRLGGPAKTPGTRVAEHSDGCTFTIPGKGATVEGRVTAPRRAFVGWVYADPDGSEHHTVNCSVSDLTLTLTRRGRPPLILELEGGAAYELGMRERDHGIEIQPVPDGAT